MATLRGWMPSSKALSERRNISMISGQNNSVKPAILGGAQQFGNSIDVFSNSNPPSVSCLD
jgi:hypothetical protein